MQLVRSFAESFPFYSGGLLTILAVALVVALSLHDIDAYQRTEHDYQLKVDTSHGDSREKLALNIDVTVAMPCLCNPSHALFYLVADENRQTAKDAHIRRT